MNVHLVVGDRDAFRVKPALDLLEQVKVERPVVGCVHPYAAGDLDRGVAVLGHADDRLGIPVRKGVVAERAADDPLGLLKIVAVADRKDEVEAAGRLIGEVDDLALATSPLGMCTTLLSKVFRIV